MPNLIPTPIVDKNGKQTTVRKAATTAPSKPRNVPAPSATMKAHVPQTIHDFRRLSKREADLFVMNGGIIWGPRIFDQREKITSHQNGIDAISLAMHFQRKGKMDEGTLRFILNDCELILTDSANVYNSLLMVEYLSRAGDPEVFDNTHSILSALRGFPANSSSRREPIAQFKTEDQLSRHAAVIEYIIRQEDVSNTVSNVNIFVKDHHVPFAKAITNKHLEKLIRNYPKELDAIIAYIDERGMDRKTKPPVDALREWMESKVSPALREGWL